MTTVVFLHAPGESFDSWLEVADHLPPAWALAAPHLTQCASREAIGELIDRDAHKVSDEPVVLVARGLAVRVAQDFYRTFTHRVESVIAIDAEYRPSLRQLFSLRSEPYFQAVRTITADISIDMTVLSPHEVQYPAQTAAAVYRAIAEK
ncbi:hypothetical protein JTE88_07920 [Arcanobacterium phocisimile]|uniref:Shikimate kinase n=1 Tax=Arcanobacterium phocisimile TaxID=1302235 RepID=A0ABX7IHQ8_9ACTO|nr:hypothetical protein [Arcanobacterium phocisimile]QRV01994.1 hypothetical protein JTE88_07920 [Arcanobacterium phocisimile]